MCSLTHTHPQNSAGSEGRMMRRTIAVLSRCLDFVEKRVGYVCCSSPFSPLSLTRLSAHMEFGGGGGGVRMQGRLPKTKDALAALIDTVQRHFVI